MGAEATLSPVAHKVEECAELASASEGDQMIRNLLVIVYLLVGLVVANNNDYLSNLSDINSIVSAALAVLLWPLVLLGIDLHIGSKAVKRN
jgi:hypothetical protein